MKLSSQLVDVGALVEVFNPFGVSIAFGLTNQDGQSSTFVFTNENGQYVVEELLRDTYTIFVRATNYLEQQQIIVLIESEFAPVNFQFFTYYPL